MLTRAPKTTFAVADWASTIAQLCSVVGMVLMNVRVTLSPTLNVSAGPGALNSICTISKSESPLAVDTRIDRCVTCETAGVGVGVGGIVDVGVDVGVDSGSWAKRSNRTRRWGG